MAAPIRVRISKVQFDNSDFNHLLIDPFWLLVSDAKYPNISDIKKKILLICEDAILSKRKGSQTNNTDDDEEDRFSDGSGADSENTIDLLSKWKHETSTCQLWLDGCRLPDSEQTAVLRENDSLIVKFAKNRKSRPGFVNSHVSPSKIDFVEEQNGVIPKQKHRKRNQKQTIDLSQDNISLEFEKSTLAKENHPSKKRKINDDRIVSDGEEVNVEGSHQKKKKQKRKKVKGYNNDCEEEKIKDVSGEVSGRLSVDENKDLQTQQENDELEKLKQNMLSYLDKHSAELGQCLTLTNDVKSPESNDKDMTSPDIPMIKRKRRRKSKRTKRSEETPKTVKVVDKPRSSILNLPWDQRPQNTKHTFKSDEEELVESVVAQNECMPNVYEKIRPEEDTEKLETLQSHSNHIDKVTNKAGNISNSLCPAREEGVVNKSHGHAVLLNKTRKYMMRSTMSILDSLKSSSSISPDVTKTSHGKPVSPATHASNGKRVSPATSATDGNSRSKPVVTSKSSCSLSDTNTSVNESSSLLGTKSSKGEPNITSSATNASMGKSSCPSQITDSPNRSLINPPLGKSSHQASVIDNSLVGSYVDPSAKFSELLQRRKFSNGTCTISTTQNGVTVCSRQKSQRGKNAFADPNTDVLTNKSTIVKQRMLPPRSIVPSSISSIAKHRSGITLDQCNDGGNVELSVSTIPEPTESPQAKKLPTVVAKGDATAMTVDMVKDIGCDKVEVIPVDLENCPLLSGSPQKGDVLAYKVLEMMEDYTPAVSSFKIGKVLACENDSVHLEGFGNSVPKKKMGKFELLYGDEEEDEITEDSKNYEQVYVALDSMMDTRLVKR